MVRPENGHLFLDVGAHEGQTLEEVIDARYGFAEIHAFEPMPQQFETLRQEWAGRSRRVSLHNFGLASEFREAPLYGSNEQMEASIFAGKFDVDASVSTLCQFRSAADVVESIGRGLVVKLNCEGAEVEILDSLIDSEQIWKIANVLIDFDIRKVPGLESEAERILARLAEIGFERFSLAEQVMVGPTHQARIRNWLDGVLPR